MLFDIVFIVYVYVYKALPIEVSFEICLTVNIMPRSINCLLRPSYCYFYYKLRVKYNCLLLDAVLRTVTHTHFNIRCNSNESIIITLILLYFGEFF